ncbi:MAG: hypothetical protein CFE44_01645 [Burkholderiales bacterium PBB4]|nr:MAG: hypothetical protein CFE44_01645 [Burkholderiales bacterium PBB4]
MICRRKFTLVTLGAIFAHETTSAMTLDAPNVVEISPSLVTAGQPTSKALAQLGLLGFQAVIYLAPNTVPDAVKDEPDLLMRQAIEFIHIPIPFDTPTEEHAVAVTEALMRLKEKRVLVHCQVNMRASTMVFLHRTTTLKENPAHAYDAVSRVWSPRGPWRALLIAQLKKHKIEFQPF